MQAFIFFSKTFVGKAGRWAELDIKDTHQEELMSHPQILGSVKKSLKGRYDTLPSDIRLNDTQHDALSMTTLNIMTFILTILSTIIFSITINKMRHSA